MIKRSTIIAVALLSSTAVLAQKGPDAAGPGGGDGAPGGAKMEAPGASGAAPGQMKEPGPSARDKAPGQMKSEGESARDMAPGQAQRRDESGDKQRSGDASDKKMSKDRTADEASPDGPGTDDRKAATGSGSGKEGKQGDRAEDRDRKSGGSIAEVAPEKKAKVRSAFGKHRVQPADIDINVRVGVVVPRSVKFYPVPQDIIVIAPAYRDYLYFVVDDRICIVDPDSYEVVEIIVIA